MSSSNATPAAEGKTQIVVDPPYYHHVLISSHRLSVGQLTWNQPSSSPLATLSPAFFDHPIAPTSMARCTRSARMQRTG